MDNLALMSYLIARWKIIIKGILKMILTSETKGEVFPNLIPIFSNSVVSCIVGFVEGIILTVILLCCVKKIIKSIEDGVMKVSIIGAMACLSISIFIKEVDKSINILSFFCSFIFRGFSQRKAPKKSLRRYNMKLPKHHIGISVM